MPYPTHNRLWAGSVRGLDDYDSQVRGFIENQHKDDGAHGAMTADSLAITGDLTVGGVVGFEDLSGNTINCVTLHVDGETTMDGTLIVQGAISTVAGLSAIGPASGGVVLIIEDTTVNGAGQTLYVQPIDGASIVNIGDPNVAGGGGDTAVTICGTLSVLATGSGTKFSIDGASGDLAVNTNKFTVDGPTGNTVIAGTITSEDLLIGPWGGSSSYTAISLNGSVATGAYNFLASTADTNLYINRPSGKQIVIGENNNQSDLIINSGGQITLNTFYNTGVLVSDTNGNITSETAITADLTGDVTGTASGNLVPNGVGNSFQFIDTLLNTITLTVVNGQVTVYA